MEFYRQNIDAIVQQFRSNLLTGLDENAVQFARQQFGKNILKSANARSVLQIILGQFAGPLIIVLIVAALISFYLKQPKDGIILLIIVVINALIGFYQEWKSENILASIKKLVVDKCTVTREGMVIELFSEDLVPGDIVLLSEGVGIPADIRLFETDCKGRCRGT